jgi:hypothetical protein
LYDPVLDQLLPELTEQRFACEALSKVYRKPLNGHTPLRMVMVWGPDTFPDAFLKFYCQATLNTRVERRLMDYHQNGKNINFEMAKTMVTARDKSDANHPIYPLRKSGDMVVLDTECTSASDILYQVIHIAKAKLPGI